MNYTFNPALNLLAAAQHLRTATIAAHHAAHFHLTNSYHPQTACPST